MTQRIKQSLKTLVESDKRKSLPAVADRAGLGVGEGISSPKVPPKTSGTGTSIAGPLTETAYNARNWYDEFTVYASDGFFSHTARRIKQVTFTDANGNEVPQIFKDKPPA
jgi:hypothetical protein